VTAQGSLGQVDKGHGVGEEGVRAARGHRDPTFVAGRPNLCGTSPNLYDNVQFGPAQRQVPFLGRNTSPLKHMMMSDL